VRRLEGEAYCFSTETFPTTTAINMSHNESRNKSRSSWSIFVPYHDLVLYNYPCAQKHQLTPFPHQKSVPASAGLKLTDDISFDNHGILCVWKTNHCNSSRDPCISSFEAGEDGQLCQIGTALEDASHGEIINYSDERQIDVLQQRVL
jgi:hypothetical protein